MSVLLSSMKDSIPCTYLMGFFLLLQATHVQVSLTEILNSVHQAHSQTREWYWDLWFTQMVPWHISRCRSCHQQHDGESFWCHCYLMINCMISSWQALFDQTYWLFPMNVFLHTGKKMTSKHDRTPTSEDIIELQSIWDMQRIITEFFCGQSLIRCDFLLIQEAEHWNCRYPSKFVKIPNQCKSIGCMHLSNYYKSICSRSLQSLR